MDVFLDPDAEAGLAAQIYAQIRDGILEGRLSAGDRLPPSRELAATLQVSRHTVTTAYGRLVAEGYLDGRRGGGTVVSSVLVPAAPPAPPPPVIAVRRPAGAIAYDLRAGTPDRRLFPAAAWARCLRRAVDAHDGGYGDPAGEAALRAALAAWIGRSRGVVADPAQVVVTSGAQQALYLLVRVAARAGDVVAVEDPGYPPFRAMAEAAGARCVPVRVDAEGIVVDAIPEEARLVYVTPTHQFPSGVTLSLRRRLALLDVARRRGALVVEDDYDSELRYVDRPLEPLFRLDRAGVVAYVGTFSKVLSPALRLGFAVLPHALVDDVVTLRRLVDWAPSSTDQLALRDFIVDGLLDRHLRRARRVYGGRQKQVVAAMQGLAAGGAVSAPASNAGLHVGVRLRDDVDEAALLTRLAARGLALQGFASCSVAATTPGLVIGFGRIADEDLPAALAALGEVLTAS